MPRKKIIKQYTTIQISSELNEHIRMFCDRFGLKATPVTERYWAHLITSSLSGSITLQG